MKAAAQGTLWGSQCLPSIAGAGKSGTRFANMAAFPRCSKMASLPHRCLTASSSFCPDWRASAAPSLSTSVTATSCHPPKDSVTMGKKMTPSRWQASAAFCILLLKVSFRAYPAAAAASTTVPPLQGLTTATSKATSCCHSTVHYKYSRGEGCIGMYKICPLRQFAPQDPRDCTRAKPEGNLVGQVVKIAEGGIFSN